VARKPIYLLFRHAQESFSKIELRFLSHPLITVSLINMKSKNLQILQESKDCSVSGRWLSPTFSFRHGSHDMSAKREAEYENVILPIFDRSSFGAQSRKNAKMLIIK